MVNGRTSTVRPLPYPHSVMAVTRSLESNKTKLD